MAETSPSKQGRGRDAASPLEIPAKGWKDILWRVKDEIGTDRVTLIAAGATFYLLLALFPALAAFVSVYGFVADPVTIADHIAFLGTILPQGGVELIGDQLKRLTEQPAASLSFGVLSGLAFALWSANNGIKTLFEAMNIAYGETEKRGFFKLNLITLGVTLGAIVLGVVMISAVGVVPAILAVLNLGSVAEVLISFLRWPVLIAFVAVAVSVLYRYGPSREPAEWRWVTWGSGFVTIAWTVMSLLFSWYLTNIADYNATYGSLGALMGFMMWTWLSVVILISGAELNSEMEHQTARDTTTGADLPMGERGAVMADTLGKTADEPDPGEGHAVSARRDVPKEEGKRAGIAAPREGRPQAARPEGTVQRSVRASDKPPADRRPSTAVLLLSLLATAILRPSGKERPAQR